MRAKSEEGKETIRMRLHFLAAALAAIILFKAPAEAQQARAVVPVSATGPLASDKVYGRSFALLIGINQYVNTPANNLHYAIKDVTALRDILVRSYGFPAENITVLTDAEATRDKIRAALDELTDTKRIGKDDRILIYFSCHGQTVKLGTGVDTGFLIPYDAAKIDLADTENIGPYRKSCLPIGEIRETMDASPARHILLLADCCFSGLLADDKGLPKALPQLSPDTLAVMAHKRTRQIITAGRAGETAQEDSRWGHGAFTYKLLEELEAQAALEVTAFTARSLYVPLQAAVLELTNQKQNPKFADRDTEGEFLFITTASHAVPPQVHDAPPPPTAGELTAKAFEKELHSYQDALKGGSSLPFLRKYAPARFSEWRQEAEKGNPIAEFFVARCYDEGISAPNDYKMAVKWAAQSANHGNMFGMNLLGCMYEAGLGVDKDSAAAMQWFQKAAERGNGLAMLNLGKSYADLENVEHDYGKAMQSYRKAVDTGYSEAMRLIGDLYANGNGVKKDPVEAKKWYRQAADAGDTASAGLLMADRVGPAFKSYSEGGTTQQSKSSALALVRSELADYNSMDLAAANAVLHGSDLLTAVDKLRGGEKTDALLTIHGEMVDRYLLLYQQASLDMKAQYLNAFAPIVAPLVKKWYESGQYNAVADFWKKSYEGLSIAKLTEGEKDPFVGELSLCANALLKAGNLKEGARLLTDTLALCTAILKERSWDWYTKEACIEMCWESAATMSQLGDSSGAVQSLLQAAWTLKLKEYGKESLLKTYAKLPLKGQSPEGASAADAEVFKYFRSEADKAKDKTSGGDKKDKAIDTLRLTIPTDFDGVKYPLYVYILTGKNGYTELLDQFRWVKEYRGGNVPSSVRDSFARLNKIALENNVDFEALCDYVFTEDDQKKKAKNPLNFDFSLEDSFFKDLKDLEAKKPRSKNP